MLNGTFDGFAVNKDLTIKGGTIRSVTGIGDAQPVGILITGSITLNIEDVVFNGFGVSGNRRGVLTNSGTAPTVNIKDSTFRNLDIGVYFNPSVSGSITGSTFDNISYAAIAIENPVSYSVTGNTISNSNIGLELFGPGITTYSDNKFLNVTTNVK